jgi:hypothetical protein
MIWANTTQYIRKPKTPFMKQILATIAIAATTLTACTTNNGQADAAAQLQAFKDSLKLAADTAGLAQFQAMKAQNELGNTVQYNDPALYAAAPAAVAAAPVRKSAPRAASTTRRSNTYQGGTASSTSTNAAKKKGWSKAAKGTAIGAGTGAVLGAVINKKNRVVGGVIGGVVGGGVGYGIGRGMDKKDGRY